MYCDKCKHIFDGEHCPNCRKGRMRQVRPDDPCFPTEKRSPFSGMLEDVLWQNDIPLLMGDCLGAGLPSCAGSILEVNRFYVRWNDLERAKPPAEKLFGAVSEEQANFICCRNSREKWRFSHGLLMIISKWKQKLTDSQVHSD